MATVAVAVAARSVQLAVPQLYPLGQQPAARPPESEGQTNQPVAHVPVDVAEGTAESGTTTVTPLDMMVVDAGGGGQEVDWQSRPSRQQPGSATASQL